jgi:hypothetical protein
VLTVRGWTVAAVAALVAALAGCGEQPAAAPVAPAGQTEAVADPGAFPDEPLLREQFGDPAAGWPATGYQGDGTYRLAAGDGDAFVTAPAPLVIEPGTAGTLAEAEVTLGGAGGRAGLFCRGSEDGQTMYALSVSANGAWALERYEEGNASVLESGTLPEGIVNPPGQPNLLRLICGAGEPGATASLVVTVNATPYITAQDPDSIDPGTSSRVGLFAASEGGAFEARFDNVAVWVAKES